MTNLVQFPGLGLSFEINRVALSIGGFNIYWYGVCIAFGICLALVFAFRHSIEFGVDPDSMVDVILIGIVLGIVSARAYYVAMAPFKYESICFTASGASLSPVNRMQQQPSTRSTSPPKPGFTRPPSYRRRYSGDMPPVMQLRIRSYSASVRRSFGGNGFSLKPTPKQGLDTGIFRVLWAAASVMGSGFHSRCTLSVLRGLIRPWRSQAARICSKVVFPAAASTQIPGA